MISEELSESMEHFRSRYLREVANAAQDDDANRAAHRLQLLAGSGMTEACGLVSKARTRARDLLQGTASLKAGDKKSLQSFMAKLPIESMLTVVDRKDRHQDATQSSTGRRSIHPNIPLPETSYSPTRSYQ